MNGTRTLKLVSLALATALLGGGAWLAQGGLKQLARERQQFAQLQQELDNARRLLPEVQQREQLVRSIQNVSQQVGRMALIRPSGASAGCVALRGLPAALRQLIFWVSSAVVARATSSWRMCSTSPP